MHLILSILLTLILAFCIMIDSFVVVVTRNRQNLFRILLTNNEPVEIGVNLLWRRQRQNPVVAGFSLLLGLGVALGVDASSLVLGIWILVVFLTLGFELLLDLVDFLGEHMVVLFTRIRLRVHILLDLESGELSLEFLLQSFNAYLSRKVVQFLNAIVV